MRTIAVVTVDRSDFGIYRSLLKRLMDEPSVRLQLVVSGTHLSPEFGYTVRQIESEGFPVDDQVEVVLSSDSPAGIAKSVGLGILGFAQVFARRRPDVLVLLGDRFEMHAAAVAALPFQVPIAHIHGGELTFGAIDESLRHSITKMSHLHFAATEEYARRIRQLGEEPWRVSVVGAPALDGLGDVASVPTSELEARLGVRLEPAPLVVTFHPATVDDQDPAAQVAELLAALEGVDRPIVFTRTNADAGGRAVAARIEGFVQRHTRAVQVGSLGSRAYFGLLTRAAAMVGNSSSGLVEAPSFALPVVNVGPRQAGRVRARNVIDVSCERQSIADGIGRALDPEFRSELRGITNPYRAGGDAAGIIVDRLLSVPLDQTLLTKRFFDMTSA